MTGLVIALRSATGFAGAGLLALAGRDISTERRLDVIAIAAAILLALAFGDFCPTSLELAGQPAIAGFIGGFAFLFLVEAFSRMGIRTTRRMSRSRHTRCSPSSSDSRFIMPRMASPWR